MKLRWSPTSPYVRKATATLIETGLEDRVERITTNAWDPATDLARDNPLGKVPALITDGGEVLYDSPVICEYLDSLHDGRKLFPRSGGDRWTALRRQALGDGIIDAAVFRLLEGRRPPELQSQPWVDRQRAVVSRGLDALEDEAGALGGAITIGHLAIACALGYLDFRFPGDDWRAGRPGLAAWYDSMTDRRSIRDTVPREAT